ncbi:mitochondrial pyruvate carrier SCDLUD_004803 [Saccharomycodes ludwigii]|uniref:mitochondrial pyruvate carrier n=1 Tax=Saccharomycodes ludwigii TaxID=36035 RepID=UPI001E89B66B|nr:hypothetical protein SCDLUD_004803 [Saccharomycodes ludwigii]KAH3899362.1 hypothetical protein SCDLUD_004803 [Saccharomycodes ludwigii]
MATRFASSGTSSFFRNFWNSETGPKTVHFWAPAMKWGLVFAGINDIINRPVEKISGLQNLSLMATGLIWTRWSFVIKPRNMLLASVNFFLGSVASFQIYRIMKYRRDECGDNYKQIASYLLHGETINVERGDSDNIDDNNIPILNSKSNNSSIIHNTTPQTSSIN